MKKAERIISVVLLFIISLSNLATPVSYAAQIAVAKIPPPASNKIAPPGSSPSFNQPDSGSVLGASTSLFEIGTQSLNEVDGTLGSAGKRIPIRMQQLAKRVYQTDENVDLAVTNPDNDSFSTAVVNAKGQGVNVPITETNDGTTTNVQIAGSNEVTPGIYTIKVTDNSGNVTTQDFSWGVLALNPDKDMYHPGETANLSMGVLDDSGNMVCDAQLILKITNQAGGSIDTLSTTLPGKDQIIVNPQCQQHGFSLQPDYQAQYTFDKAGTYTMQLTATTQSGTHSITDTVPVTNDIPFDIQRVSATRIYPPNTYPMTINIKANRDFSGTVTDTVPEDFIITPATMSATPVNSYIDMETMYLNSQDPAAQLEQAITASGSGGLVMPFHGYYPITQGFGAQMTDPTLQAFYTQYGLAGHDGVDFGVPMDTPLYAVDDGNVIQSGPGDYGTTIIIQHAWGQSYYGHLSTTAVSVGTHVTKGQLIGYSGESGEATGPHLHFGMRPNNPDMTNGYYGKVDPLPYLPYNNQQTQSLTTLDPTLAQPAANQNILGASDSATPTDASDSATVTPTVSQSTAPSILPSALTPTQQISPSPTVIPSPTPESNPTTTITESTTPPANTAISVLDKQILLNEQLANSSETEKVKVITWHVSLKKGDTTSLGYDFQAPPQSPQFYLLGPIQFYQNGSDKVVFQEQRQWQIASDDVGVSWYTNNSPNTWNGYSWQYRKKIAINASQVSVASPGVTYDATGGGSIVTWNHTVSGSNPALLVGVAVGVNQVADTNYSASATYNGVSMNLLSTVHPGGGNTGFLDVFGLLNVPTGTHAVVVNVTGGFATVTAGSESFDNVTSFATAVSASGISATASATTSGSTSGNIVAGFVATGTSVTSATSPATSRFIANYTSGSQAGNCGGATSPSTGSNVTMAWTVGSDSWGATVVEVKGTSVAYDATGPSSSGYTPSGISSLSWNHTVSGTNPALLAEVSVGGAGNVSGWTASATYDGVSMTLLKTVLIDNIATAGLVDVFGLLNAPTGTHTIAVTFTGGTATEMTDGSESFDNVSSFGTAASAFGNSATASVATSGSTTGNIVAGFVGDGSGGGAASAPATNEFLSQIDTLTAGGNSAGAISPSTGSNVTISWPIASDDWAAVAVEVQGTNSYPTADFMEAGGQATNTNGGTDLTTITGGFYSGSGGTAAYDTSTAENVLGSIKITSSSSSQSYVEASGVANDSGRRISLYINFASFPSSGVEFDGVDTSGGGSIILGGCISSTGVLSMCTNGSTQIGSNGPTLSTNTWYRIDFSYTITSTTNYSFKMYVNGSPSTSYSQTSGGTPLEATGTSDLYIGWDSTSIGSSDVMHIQDVYVDSGTDLSDPGNVHVTAKLPIANGTTDSFATKTGTPTGDTICQDGSTNCEYVNERPLNTAALLGGARTTQESFTIQGPTKGDVNIAGDNYIADEAWIDTEEQQTGCTGATIINNGTSIALPTAISTSYQMETNIANNSTYPYVNTAVGERSCTNTGTHAVNLAEAGMQIAYVAPTSGSLANFPVLINLSRVIPIFTIMRKAAAMIFSLSTRPVRICYLFR